jgi:hypothetical protein
LVILRRSISYSFGASQGFEVPDAHYERACRKDGTLPFEKKEESKVVHDGTDRRLSATLQVITTECKIESKEMPVEVDEPECIGLYRRTEWEVDGRHCLRLSGAATENRIENLVKMIAYGNVVFGTCSKFTYRYIFEKLQCFVVLDPSSSTPPQTYLVYQFF